jgi:predicted component of type VI protein secretion system
MDYATPNPHTFPNPNTTHPNQFQHEQQSDRQTFAQAFSKGLKIEFPKFDGDNPVGWLRQTEKCFTLAATPMDRRVHLAEIFLIGRADH